MAWYKHATRVTLAIVVICMHSQNAWSSSADTVVRGLVRATNMAVISSELVARVGRLPYRDGQSFKRDDLLIAFDCRRYEAEIRSTSAQVRAALLAYDANLKLQKHNAVGTNEVEISLAKLDEVKAQLEVAEIQRSHCKVKAPYDGRIVNTRINEYDLVKANEPLIEIVGSDRLEIDLLVPSKWLVWIQPGQHFEFTIDETLKTYSARIERVSAVVDPISQTAKLSAVFSTEHENVLPGMSGTARLSPIN